MDFLVLFVLLLVTKEHLYMICDAFLVEIIFWYGTLQGNFGGKFFQLRLCLWGIEFWTVVSPSACGQNSILLSPVKNNKGNVSLKPQLLFCLPYFINSQLIKMQNIKKVIN